MMNAALMPRLTRLDRLVLDFLSVHDAMRAGEVVAEVARYEERYRPRAERTTEQDVREILRGLAHVGLATYSNGWWRRSA